MLISEELESLSYVFVDVVEYTVTSWLLCYRYNTLRVKNNRFSMSAEVRAAWICVAWGFGLGLLVLGAVPGHGRSGQ